MDPHAFTLRRASNVSWKTQTMLPLLPGKDDDVERTRSTTVATSASSIVRSVEVAIPFPSTHPPSRGPASS